MSEQDCDREVFRDGKGVCIFHAPANVAEPWVSKVRELSEQRVDWHYSGGYCNVLYIGDYDRVRSAVESMSREGLEAFRVLPPESHGLYRQGDLDKPTRPDLSGLTSVDLTRPIDRRIFLRARLAYLASMQSETFAEMRDAVNIHDDGQARLLLMTWAGDQEAMAAARAEGDGP